MKLREEEFYEQYHQHGGTTIIPTEIFNELYDDATEEIERLHSIIKEVREYIINIPDDEFVESEHFTELLEILDKVDEDV